MKAKKPKILESHVRRGIMNWCKYTGWFYFWNLQGLGCYKGLADLTLLKNGIVLFVEVKTSTGKQSEYQKEFQKRIEIYGGHYVLARSFEDVELYIKEKGIT